MKLIEEIVKYNDGQQTFCFTTNSKFSWNILFKKIKRENCRVEKEPKNEEEQR